MNTPAPVTLPPPPHNPAELDAWRQRADALPRVQALTKALDNAGRARLFEAAIQAGAKGYLHSKNNGNFIPAFRVLFPELPAKASQKAIRARIEEMQTP